MKKVVSYIMCGVILFSLCDLNAVAKESYNNTPEKQINSFDAVLQDAEILSVEEIELSDKQEDELALCTEKGLLIEKEIPLEVDLKKYVVQNDSKVDVYYSLDAYNEKKSSNDNDYMYGSITWKDNTGPANELISVFGYSKGGKSIYSYQYGSVGFGSTYKTVTETCQAFAKSKIGLTGLQFELRIKMKDSDALFGERTLTVFTSVLD